MRVITGLVAFAMVLLMGMAPAHALDLEDLQAAVDVAQAEVDRLTAALADAQSTYDTELASWQASVDAYDAHLAEVAAYEAAEAEIIARHNCSSEVGGGRPAECRAERQAELDALTPPGEAPPEPGPAPSDAELISLQQQLATAQEDLAAAQAALDAFEPDSPEPGDGDPSEGEPGDGDPSEGEPGNGDPGEGEPADGDPGEGEPTDGDTSEDEPKDGEPTDGGTDGDDPKEGEPTDGGPTEGAPTEGAPVDDMPADPQYEFSCTDALAGSEVTCSVRGLDPGQQVRVTVTVNPILFDDTITADTRGVATFTFTVPADLPAGSVLAIRLETLDGVEVTTAALTVAAADDDASDDAEAAADAAAEAAAVMTADTGATNAGELPTTGQPIGALLLLGLSTMAFGAALSRQRPAVRSTGL